jgi:hypothetical protein
MTASEVKERTINAEVRRIKGMGADFILALHEIGKTIPADARQVSRESSLAQTRIR